MTVSYVFLILILAMTIKREIMSTNTNYFLAAIIILLASGIISICSRLDDLKRK